MTESPGTCRFCPGCAAPLPDLPAAREALAVSQAKGDRPGVAQAQAFLERR